MGRYEMIVEMSKGKQITIPAEIRNQFDLDAGSRLEIARRRNEIVLKPIGDDLQEMFSDAAKRKPKHNLTAKQMDELNESLFR